MPPQSTAAALPSRVAPVKRSQRLAASGIDGLTLLVAPAALFLLALFVYPFLYGLVLSFAPKEGGAFSST